MGWFLRFGVAVAVPPSGFSIVVGATMGAILSTVDFGVVATTSRALVCEFATLVRALVLVVVVACVGSGSVTTWFVTAKSAPVVLTPPLAVTSIVVWRRTKSTTHHEH